MRGGIAVAVWLTAVTGAQAGVADWRVSEVFPAGAAVTVNPAVRFVELHAPPPAIDNCFFPTTRLEIYDAQGLLLDAVTPFAATTCFPSNTYFLFATPDAAAAFGVPADAPLPAIPADAGQVCLTSSQTRYDCARWGPITDPVAYFRNVDDATSGPGIPAGASLARLQDTGVVADDFVLQAPTPRQPNDGTVIPTPDAGPPPPDAPPVIDAAPFPDAPPFPRADARVFGPTPDAAETPVFIEARPGGGGCACSAAGEPPPFAWLLVPLFTARRTYRRRRGCRGRTRV